MAIPHISQDLRNGCDAPPQYLTDSLCAARDDLRQEISRLKAKLAELEALERRHAALSSPAQHLPFEILGEIFLLVSPAAVRNHEQREELLNLGLVCEHWRWASIATKGLWSGVIVDYRDFDYEGMAAWLKRSESFGKRVEFTALPDSEVYDEEIFRCPCLNGTSTEEGCRAVLPTLVRLFSEGPQLAHLTLDLESTQCYRNFREAIDRHHMHATAATSRWDKLSSLDLRMLYTMVGVGELVGYFSGLPSANLQSLRLDLPSIDTFDLSGRDQARLEFGENPSLHIPLPILKNLMSFSIKYNWGSTHVLDATQHCSENLEVLAIDVSPETPGIFAAWEEMREFMQRLSVNPIVFEKLHTLDVRNADPEHPDNCYLSCLRAPDLRHLTLVGRSKEIVYTGEPEGDPVVGYSVMKFLQQNGTQSSLRTMHLENIPHEDARVNYFVSEHPLLESVKLPGTWSLKTYSKIWRNFRSMKGLAILNVPVDWPILSQIMGVDWERERERKGAPPCELMISYEQPEEVVERMCERMGRAEMDGGKLVVRL